MKSTTSHLPPQMPKTFLDLNRLHQLRPVADEVDLQNATQIMDRLAVINKPTRDQSDYLDTLNLLIERYESARYPIDQKKASPLQALSHLLAANGMKQADLAKLLDVGPSSASMILSGKRPITADHARKLGRRFAVEPGLFL
jgi:antitoxin component HigA of HigAB toxin-antitoxin module